MQLYLKASLFAASMGLMTHSGFPQISLNLLSSARNGDAAEIFDESAAEIVSYDSATQQMYVVNGSADAIDIFDVSDPASPKLVTSVDLSAYGNPNSVDVNPRAFYNEVAVAIGSGDAEVRGTVVFMTKDGAITDSVEVGYLPDMLTYDSRGFRLVVANEGEPSDDYSFDGEGSVSIIERRGRNRRVVTNVTFEGISEDDLNGARITGPEGTTIAQDLEPEYIAIDSNNRIAYVACQENNAIITIDLVGKKVVNIFGLGFKDHGKVGNALDASDRDGMIRIANWPVKGLYMPDSIATYSVGKETYIVTANEGDAREYGDYIDESRVKDLEEDFGITLDPSAFPLASELVKDENLGRLNVIITEGNLDDDSELEELYCYGARSFSIFSTTGELIFDSGDFIECYLAVNYPDDFNSSNDANDDFDSRSDAKGPEPEAVTIGEIDGKTYAFVGLERMGGVMIFDITDPTEVSFESYTNNRNFAIDFDDEAALEIEAAGDLGPEGIEFVSAKSSPNGKPLLIVANEVSGTTTVFEIVSEL